MATETQSIQVSDAQLKAFKTCIGVSIAGHLLLVLLPSLYNPRPIMPAEIATDVTLISDFDLDAMAVPRAAENTAKEDQEALSDPKMLPQLPKRFEIKEPEEKKVAAIDPEREEKKESKDANAEKNKAGEEEAKKKEKELIEISKKNAFERLMKEQERLRKKEGKKAQEEAKKAKEEIKELLNNRKKEIAELSKGGITTIGGDPNLNQHPYVGVLRVWIKKHYNLPEIYAQQFAGKPDPIVEIVLSSEGGLAKIDLIQSSSDPVLDQLAIKTIEDSAPFPTPPLDFVGKIIHVPFNH